MKQGDRLVLIKPYVDMQTRSVVTTITYRFVSNSDSVLALDVDLKKMQGVIEQVAKSSPHSFSVVLDQSGGVVVHSQRQEVGRNYLLEHGNLGNRIARNVIREKQKQFELSFDGTAYIIYADEIRGGWYSVSAVNLDEASLPLKRILAASLLLLMLTVLVIGGVFIRMSKRDLVTQNMNRQLMTIGDLFDSMIEIDIPIDLFREIDGDQHTKLGGDEFAAYAIGATQAAGQGIIDRLFACVDALRIPEMGGKKITISVGVTFFDGSRNLQFRDLYEQADASVYISKEKDKSESHVTFYEGQPLTK